MTEQHKHPKFELHVEGASTKDQVVPLDVLVQILENTQRAFELIGLDIEGREIKERARIPAAVSKKFQLFCEVPVPGSYALPVTIGDPAVDPQATDQISQAWDKFRKIAVAVATRSEQAIKDALPDSRLRRKVLDAFKGMAPSPGVGWKLDIYGADKARLAEFNDGVRPFIYAINTSIQEREEAQTITGELHRIDFSARKLEIIYPPTNRSLDCHYDENIEDTLYENRRQMIQVTGRVVIDEHGLPKEILDVSDITNLDLSAFEIDIIKSDSLVLRAKQKLMLEPQLDESKQYMSLEHSALGIAVYAPTRAKLFDELNEQVAMLWKEYALAADADLSADAQSLKASLKSNFEENK